MPRLSQRIISILQEIMRRCEENDRIRIPREGVERTIRGWLMCELFHDVLGWKMKSIIQAERFDIGLFDEYGHIVVYVETKSPSKLSDAEETTFLRRSRHYQTIRYGVLTDLYEWRSFKGDDGLDARRKRVINLTRTQADEPAVTKFFQPLQAKYYW